MFYTPPPFPLSIPGENKNGDWTLFFNLFVSFEIS